MRTIYSLKEFHQRAVDISGEEPNKVSVRVELELYGQMQFTCYTTGTIKFFKGNTMEESLQKLSDTIHPPEKPNIDVEIDIETIIDEPESEPTYPDLLSI